MRQAARISDRTAFSLLGKLIEENETNQRFTRAQDQRTEDDIIGCFGEMRLWTTERTSYAARSLRSTTRSP